MILLVVYRSPLLPLLVIGTAGLALTAANAVAYLLADGGLIAVNGQSQGIASILVVGAATDYGLLLVARFREELRHEQSKYTAMRIALHRSWEPIVASGATVVLGVLCLLLSDLGSNRGLGPISAVSVTPRGPGRAHLPARRARPARPRRVLAVPPAVRRRAEGRAAAGRGSPRSSAAVPAGCSSCSVGALLVAAALRAHLRRRRHPDQRHHPGRVERDRRPGGARAGTSRPASASPTIIVTPEESWPEVAEVAAATDGVASVVPFTGRPRPGPAPSRSWSTDWSGSTPPSTVTPDSVAAHRDGQDPADDAGRRRPGRRSWAARPPATSTPGRAAPATCG